MPHHYLYTATVAGPSATPEAVAAADAASAAGSAENQHEHEPELDAAESGSSASNANAAATGAAAAAGPLSFLRSLLRPRSSKIRSPSFVSLLHRLRVLLLGVNESTQTMRLFRRVQTNGWRLYKLLLRRLTKTGELERMIVEAQLTMVPLGSCMTERVGFHPHFVTLAVRISAYLRSSKQLAEVLALEEETAAQERLLLQQSQSCGGGLGSGSRPMDGDEDETPMSTPSLAALMGHPTHANMMAPLALAGSSPAFSPILATVAAAASSSSSPSSSSSSSLSPQQQPQSGYAPSFIRPFSGVRPSHSSPSSSSSFVPLSLRSASSPSSSLSLSLSLGCSSSVLPHPPPLHLTSSDSDSNLAAQDARANHLLQLLVAVKHINRTAGTYSSLLRPILYRSLIYRNDLSDFIKFELDPVLEIGFDERNAAHEAWLGELWDVYSPLGAGRPYSSAELRVGSHWGLLGFQGQNPATDFRAMGVLGLRNLVEFARLCPIQANLIMSRSHDENQGIKWSDLRGDCRPK